MTLFHRQRVLSRAAWASSWRRPTTSWCSSRDRPRPLTLQWATYYDASDEAAISRLYGGIHPRVDDLPGRRIGALIGSAAYERAQAYFTGTATPAAAAPDRD